MMKENIDIRALNSDSLSLFCEKHNLPKFRVKQINEWLWKKRVSKFQEMTSLSVSIRNLLSENFIIKPVIIDNQEKSVDKTIKYALKLYDELVVEAVLIPSKKRITACVSSQAGCSLNCSFCATGKLKLKRNLSSAEIYDQVFILNEESKKNFEKPITNIVFMGMGEPLLNYNALIHAITLITTKKGLNMSPRRITVSTVGIAKMIKKLGDDMVKFNLAISLHSANNYKRSSIMSINEKITLSALKESIIYYYEKTKKRITYEYVLLNNLNDSIEDAEALVKFARITPCKINLIEYNPIDNVAYTKSSNRMTDSFIKHLEKNKLVVNLRKSKGKDINAACGQLINKLS